MALKVKFTNGTKVEYLTAIETEEFYNGASRRTLTFEMASDAADLTALNALCTANNCKKLQLVNDDESVVTIHEGYVLKLKVAIEPVLVNADENRYEDRIHLKLGKRTYIEETLHKLGI